MRAGDPPTDYVGALCLASIAAGLVLAVLAATSPVTLGHALAPLVGVPGALWLAWRDQ